MIKVLSFSAAGQTHKHLQLLIGLIIPIALVKPSSNKQIQKEDWILKIPSCELWKLM